MTWNTTANVNNLRLQEKSPPGDCGPSREQDKNRIIVQTKYRERERLLSAGGGGLWRSRRGWDGFSETKEGGWGFPMGTPENKGGGKLELTWLFFWFLKKPWPFWLRRGGGKRVEGSLQYGFCILLSVIAFLNPGRMQHTELLLPKFRLLGQLRTSKVQSLKSEKKSVPRFHWKYNFCEEGVLVF